MLPLEVRIADPIGGGYFKIAIGWLKQCVKGSSHRRAKGAAERGS